MIAPWTGLLEPGRRARQSGGGALVFVLTWGDRCNQGPLKENTRAVKPAWLEYQPPLNQQYRSPSITDTTHSHRPLRVCICMCVRETNTEKGNRERK